MKVKFLTSLCGGKIDYHPGDSAKIEDAEAIRLIDAGFAEAIPKKAYQEVMVKIEEQNAIEAEKQKKLEAIMYEDELKAEKEKLLARVSEINDVLGINDEDPNDLPLEDDETIVPGTDDETEIGK